ncbi:MAG: imidazole glycerol phosphate synthase subunit HisH [Thermoleophilia bacterium]|nr:imidazole glycerol phosphate synthase subunit HisH [Thermoleophilia bacterium]
MNLARSVYIVDYGAGNLRSVQKAFEHVGVPALVGDNRRDISAAPALVLPGVGAFGAAAAALRESGLAEAVLLRIEAGVPFLGVCLGLQLLFGTSEEDPDGVGLGVLPGAVKALPSTVRVPHIGWNQVEACKPSPLFAGIPEGSAFYFVHSYVVSPDCPEDVLGVTEYDEVRFVSAVQRDNVFGVQFHPEKSSSLGLRLYYNFAQIAGLV